VARRKPEASRGTLAGPLPHDQLADKKTEGYSAALLPARDLWPYLAKPPSTTVLTSRPGKGRSTMGVAEGKELDLSALGEAMARDKGKAVPPCSVITPEDIFVTEWGYIPDEREAQETQPREPSHK